MNPSCNIMDLGPVRIGRRCLLQPNIMIIGGLLTADHRRAFGVPVLIGGVCAIGGNVVMEPGVAIGNYCNIAEHTRIGKKS